MVNKILLNFSLKLVGRNPYIWNLFLTRESVAQLVEQRPFKAWVVGSIPSRLTICKETLSKPLLVDSLRGFFCIIQSKKGKRLKNLGI